MIIAKVGGKCDVSHFPRNHDSQCAYCVNISCPMWFWTKESNVDHK